MSCSITGLQELVDRVESLTDPKMVRDMQKKALLPVAKSILNEMKSVTPVSSRRNIHGIDAENIISFTYNGLGGYNIGLNNAGVDWERTRGLWFQNFKTDEPNYGWFDNFSRGNKDRWLNEARDNVRMALYTYLKRNS